MKNCLTGPVTYNQERRLLIEEIARAAGTELATQFPIVFRCVEAPHRAALEAALGQLCARHEALRTVFAPSTARRDRQLFVNLFQRTLLFVPGSYEQHVATSVSPMVSVRSFEAGRIASVVSEELAFGLDYTRPPLFRAVLCHEQKGDVFLLLVLSHLIADGWAARLIGHELNSLYASVLAERPPAPATEKLSPIDFARIEHRRARSQGAAESARYWHEHWGPAQAPYLHHSEIPFARVCQGGREAAYKVTSLDSTTVGLLRTIARRHEVTEYSVFRTALVMLFHRYTRRTRLGFWANFANRRHPGAAGMLGWCSTSHLVTTDISSTMTLTELLRQIVRVLVESQRHEWLPLPAASQVIGVNIEQPHSRISGDAWPLDERQATTSFERVKVDVPLPDIGDLKVRLRRQGSSLELVVNYDANRYDPAGVDQMLADAVAGIEMLAKRPDASVWAFGQ